MQLERLSVIVKQLHDKSKIILNYKVFGDNGLIYILEHCPQLVDLCVIRNSISDRGVHGLVQYPWKGLQFINLSYNPIGSKGCKQLSRGQWPHLQILGLAGNEFASDTKKFSIGSEGLEHLSKAQWKNLTMLKISQNGIGEKGGEILMKANWPKLKSFDVKMNALTDFSIKCLLLIDYTSFDTLKLNKNKTSETDLQDIQRRFEQKWGITNDFTYDQILRNDRKYVNNAVY